MYEWVGNDSKWCFYYVQHMTQPKPKAAMFIMYHTVNHLINIYSPRWGVVTPHTQQETEFQPSAATVMLQIVCTQIDHCDENQAVSFLFKKFKKKKLKKCVAISGICKKSKLFS
jgi:hypothetical protein